MPMALGPWRALPRPAFGPRGALKRFGPAPPRRSTPLNKKTRVKAPQKLRPAVAALAFFSLRLPCLVLRLVRLRSLAALLGRVPPAGARLSPLAVLPASPVFALRAPSRLSAAGLSLGRYRSRRSLCVFAAPPLFFGLVPGFPVVFNHPPAPPILAGGARKLCAHFSPCDLVCHCINHCNSRIAMVHHLLQFLYVLSCPRLSYRPNFSSCVRRNYKFSCSQNLPCP